MGFPEVLGSIVFSLQFDSRYLHWFAFALGFGAFCCGCGVVSADIYTQYQVFSSV